VPPIRLGKGELVTGVSQVHSITNRAPVFFTVLRAYKGIK